MAVVQVPLRGQKIKPTPSWEPLTPYRERCALKNFVTTAVAVAILVAAQSARATDPVSGDPTATEADRFVAQTEEQLGQLNMEAELATWVQSNFITVDTARLAALAGQRRTTAQVAAATAAKRFDGLAVSPVVRRKLEIMKRSIRLPSPSDDAKAAELAQTAADLAGMYSSAKWCPQDAPCLDGSALEDIMEHDRDPQNLLAAWQGWHDQARAMKPKYARMVELGREGARGLGFADVGEMWRSGYDMPPERFSAETERLWDQVKPLYTALHCHVRAKLNERYGDAVVSKTGPIPAHVLGNMWAQSWENVFDIVAPADADPGYDLDALLKQKGYDPIRITRTAETFFTSLGFAPLPQTFWERSLFTKPRDRDVMCYASTWNPDEKDDMRLKMCMSGSADDFQTVHHELGHNFYQRAYKNQSALFRTGANDGFHEAVGDTIQLSLTPAYLKQIGLLDAEPAPSKDIGLLLRSALTKVPVLPWTLVVDRWRWGVFSGEITSDNYNKAWWAMREQYQGVKRPLPADADAFDPGAKYHIAANVPYTRYFLSHILQFQFHRAACDHAGWKGPLHRCTIYGNKGVGRRFNAMLELGASKPWPEALKTFTGTERIDATAILAYYAPLKAWLDRQNKGRTCGF